MSNRVNSFAPMLGLALLGLLVTPTAHAEQAVPAKKAKPAKAAAPPAQPVLEAKAIDLIKASCARLAAAKSMTFTAVISYENPSRLGPPLIYTTKDEVTLQRPDKLRVLSPGDGPPTQFYYDGKTMTAFSPAENVAATAPAPPTIDAALAQAYDSAAIYFPFTDLIAADPYVGIADGLTRAFYIGQSNVIGGTTTDMVAIVNDAVFQQIWIGAEDKLPRMARAVFRADPSRLRHQAEFSNWQIDPVIPADTFTSASAAAAMPIAFGRPDPIIPPGMKPRAVGKATKTK